MAKFFYTTSGCDHDENDEQEEDDEDDNGDDHRRSFSKKRSSMYPVSDVTETYRLSSMRAHGENPCKSSFLPLTSVFVEIMAFSSKMMI